jgi:hypothetical protein
LFPLCFLHVSSPADAPKSLIMKKLWVDTTAEVS